MEKEFVPYEQAIALKELGFDEPCFGFWDGYNGSSHLFFKPRIKYHWLLRLFNRSPKEVSEITQYELEYLEGYNSVLAPLYQQCWRWFREKYDLDSHIKKDWTDGVFYGYEAIIECVDGFIDVGTFKTYEEAELECLKKLIEIVKSK